MFKTADDFAALLEPHYNNALQYCRALYQNKKDAEDGLQDALITAMQKFYSLKDEKKFRSWLFTIITRTFYKAYGKELKKNQLFTELNERHNHFPEVYDEEFSDRENILMDALNTLTDKEKAAILLFELGKFSIEEIKNIQSEGSTSAIKSRLSRTREKLRNTITLMEKSNKYQGGNYDVKSSLPGL
ncbi:MAG TPA: RNA polymerase sigma factor [Segetibacter sp.]